MQHAHCPVHTGHAHRRGAAARKPAYRRRRSVRTAAIGSDSGAVPVPAASTAVGSPPAASDAPLAPPMLGSSTEASAARHEVQTTRRHVAHESAARLGGKKGSGGIWHAPGEAPSSWEGAPHRWQKASCDVGAPLACADPSSASGRSASCIASTRSLGAIATSAAATSASGRCAAAPSPGLSGALPRSLRWRSRGVRVSRRLLRRKLADEESLEASPRAPALTRAAARIPTAAAAATATTAAAPAPTAAADAATDAAVVALAARYRAALASLLTVTHFGRSMAHGSAAFAPPPRGHTRSSRKRNT